ncbi:hypothetical protein M514_11549 [Trichuris suis]|uniref:Ryanodine receptor 44F n=1 Tax=Trichuris suis TaxID=68888 RepID=A0A085N668_9BILA|nr:hypothetical protein M514_11549 [Trichuris suis]
MEQFENAAFVLQVERADLKHWVKLLTALSAAVTSEQAMKLPQRLACPKLAVEMKHTSDHRWFDELSPFDHYFREAISKLQWLIFKKTVLGDVVCLTCIAPSKETGTGSVERVALAAEGFGNRLCYLENVSDRNVPPDHATSMFYIHKALSVRALREMMSCDTPGTAGSSSSHRTLLYGHAVQLRHVLSTMYLTCLSTSSATDKLAFDVGLCEADSSESCWWTIHPASKQRSEGEKVRVGDDIILVSVATERYLHMSCSKGIMTVIAAFHQTLWSVTPNSSGSVRNRNLGYVFGNDVLRLYHGNDECLTIPETWSDHSQQNIVIYEGGKSCSQARSLWRPELLHGKWQGSLIGWEQVFRIRHVTSGRFLAVTADGQVSLVHKDKATFESTAFITVSSKDVKRTSFEEKEEEGMGVAALKYGETVTFLQHLQTGLWLSCQTTAVTKKNVGKVEEKKAVAVEEARMDDCFVLFKAQGEEAQSARVIRKSSQILNRFLKGLEGLQFEGRDSQQWRRANLLETVKLMEDLIEYFAQPKEEDFDFETMQNRLRALRNRQDLFQEEGVLNMIIDTIDQLSSVESTGEFSEVMKETGSREWEQISTYLYLLVAAMIKGNHSNCTQFASAQRLDWLFNRLSNPQAAEGILDVLYCILTESPEALNLINETHVKSVISLLEKVGRDPKVLDVLSALCEGNGVAVRSSQNIICNELVCNKNFLLQTRMVDQVSSVMANIFVSVTEGCAIFKRWYFEAELEYMDSMSSSYPRPHLRVGWASSAGYVAYPGSGKKWGCNGVGDDMFSFGFDGKNMYAGGVKKTVGSRDLSRGDVIGCCIDLSIPEIRFSLNGSEVNTSFRGFSVADCLFYPVMSLSATVSCRLILGEPHGKLRYGPPEGYLCVTEAAVTPIKIQPCIVYGDYRKGYFYGPSTVISDFALFQPKPVDSREIILPKHLEEACDRLAENIHELWSMDKIEKGWKYGERRSESQRIHPCLTNYERLPNAERAYNMNLARETLKTILALSYRIDPGKLPNRVKTLRLPQNFLMSNGYKPSPLDTREISLSESLSNLVEQLAKNLHNIWAQSKVQRGWTYSSVENSAFKTSPHLVSYEYLNPTIRAANREKAGQIVKSLMVYGYTLEAPAMEIDEATTKQTEVLQMKLRTYRMERRYAVTSGKWYFEFEVRTPGFMSVGWMDVDSPPDADLGTGKLSFGYDGYLGKKWHGEIEKFGKKWNVGDVVGCFLDLTDRIICFSLNGELLLDASGAEMAFDNVNSTGGLVPAFSLGPGQMCRVNFGQNVDSLKFYTTCGLQEGYEPFCIRMTRPAPLWISKFQPEFEEIGDDDRRFKVLRVVQSGDNPPCLKIQCKPTGLQERSSLTLFRLNLPVRCEHRSTKSTSASGQASRSTLRDSNRDDATETTSADTSRRSKPSVTERRRIEVSFVNGDSATTPSEKQQDNVDPESTRRGSGFLTKTLSLDEDSSVVQRDTLKPTVLRSSASEVNLKDRDHRSDVQNSKMSESMSSTSSKRSRKPFKVLQSFGQRMRDASIGRAKKHSTPKNANTQNARSRDVSSEGSNHFVSNREGVLAVDSSESLDMPKTGPGRRPTLIRVDSEKSKQRWNRYLSRGHEFLAEEMNLARQSIVQSLNSSLLPSSLAETYTEYYFGLRIYPGQDLANIWIGWLTPQFSYSINNHLTSAFAQKVIFKERDSGATVNDQEFRSCYVVNALDLLAAVSGGSNVSKISGLLAGCIVNTATGELTFHANGRQTEMCFRVETGTLLYPTVFVIPTGKEVLQFELGRVEKTLPIASAQFNEMSNGMQLQCPPRLRIEICKSRNWSLVPQRCPRVTSLKLSDTRGWSILCDDVARLMMLYIPERDYSLDILELIEYADLQKFHQHTLQLYCSLCAHGNFKIAHILCRHVDEDQLTYAMKSKYITGQLRQGFCDLLVAMHLSCHYNARMQSNKEYIIPLTEKLKSRNYFSIDCKGIYPHAVNSTVSMKPAMDVMSVKDNITTKEEMFLRSPGFDFEALKSFVIDSLEEATVQALMHSRDLVGGTNTSHFAPLLKLFDTLLLVGLFTDEDIQRLFRILNPSVFDDQQSSNMVHRNGLLSLELDEEVQRHVCYVLSHLCDLLLQGRVETMISFAESFVGETQNDQLQRYMYIKQTDMPPAEAARRTKEFRCPPKEQMLKLLNFKSSDCNMLDEEGEVEISSMSEYLQNVLRSFHEGMIRCIGNKPVDDSAPFSVDDIYAGDKPIDWVDKLALLVVPVPPDNGSGSTSLIPDGEEAFRKLIISTLIDWTSKKHIDDAVLIREIFSLLLRQYTRIDELMKALRTTYCIHERSIDDVQRFINHLSQIRRLLSVQFEAVDEEVLKDSLWQMMNNKVFFQHPDLMRLLKVHENVMTIMVNVLSRAQQGDAANRRTKDEATTNGNDFKNSISDLVVACCKFLCFICRSSTANQAAMFEHLPFLLDNATMLLAKPSLRGSVPLDVAYYSFMDNSELALALKEDELEKVAFYLSRCGLQANAAMVAKGYPDIGWDPVEGERYVDFLRFCVWVNGECVEENANLVIRLLIRRPECLGPALKGQGEGLLRAFKDAISLSTEIHNFNSGRNVRNRFMFDITNYPNPADENEDYIDMGAAILGFYSSLVDLLGKCAPDPLTIKSGKSESLRLRSILRSLTSMDDLEGILALRFLLPNVFASNEESLKAPCYGLLPLHKSSTLLFLERVYGLVDREMMFRLLEQSFIHDFRAATILDHPSVAESDLALALNRYLCGAVLPLLTNHAHFFAEADHYSSLMDATLHTTYRMSKIRSLTNNQRSAVTDFLLALTREISPSMMSRLQQKVVKDISSLNEYAIVPLQIMTQHYEHFSRHYGSSTIEDVANEEQKRLSMLLFTTIFDSMGKRAFDQELFARALPCLAAIASALSPDYAASSPDRDELHTPSAEDTDRETVWKPVPVDVSHVQLSPGLQNLVLLFAQHFHDSWASRKLEKGWKYGETYSRVNLTHPRLRPFGMLKEFEQNFYKERCAECMKAMLAMGYVIEEENPVPPTKPATQQITPRGSVIFSPQPVDLSNMSLSEELSELAERVAQNSHLLWVAKAIDDLNVSNSGIIVQLVPWDILTDTERRKHRFRAQEILKFLQYSGCRIKSPLPSSGSQGQQSLLTQSGHRSAKTRFAYSLMEKMLLYIESAALKMEVVKGSKRFSRGSSCTLASEDVKFFSKVLLPLLEAYFRSHRNYFIATGSGVGIASMMEKEIVVNLFHRLMSSLRRKLVAFGCNIRTTVRCLQVLISAIDFKSLVKTNSDSLRTCTQVLFTYVVGDLTNIVKSIRKQGRYAEIRGKTLPCTSGLVYLNEVILPVLSTLFNHLAQQGHGPEFLVNDIQLSSYKIADSLYALSSLESPTRKSIKLELERHRSFIGQCLSAFACCFPVAFLEPEFNEVNKFSILTHLDQTSQSKELLSSITADIPSLDKVLTDIEHLSQSGGKYQDAPAIFDVHVPTLCSYFSSWWQHGPNGTPADKPITSVSSELVNRLFFACAKLICDHIGVQNANWVCHVAPFIQPMISYVTAEPVKDCLLPMTEKIKEKANEAFKEEERQRTHPEVVDEALHSVLVRDIYAVFPLIIKFTDLHRARWLKNPSWETNSLYENVAFIFKIWSVSQNMKREELNFITQLDADTFMGGSDLKTGKAAIAIRKKKRREGKKREKETNSIVVACLKRLLPVGLNVFGGRELELLQKIKEKHLKREPEERIKEFIRSSLSVPDKEDIFDKSYWQRQLYHKIGKAQMLGISSMNQEAVLEAITSMGLTLYNLHTVEHPQTDLAGAWRKILSSQRKRAVVACFRMVALHSIPRHRCINIFLPAYAEKWMEDENMDRDLLICDLADFVEKGANVKRTKDEAEEEDLQMPDSLSQLIQCFQRAATAERKQLVTIERDELYKEFVRVMAISIHIGEEEEDGNADEAVNMEAQELEKQELRHQQARLADRGAAVMVLMYLSACHGEPNDMVDGTLKLGIHILNGGNSMVQDMMLAYLQDKKDVSFFSSIAGLMNRGSVLNLEIFERQIKAEGLGMGAELSLGDHQNLNDAEFICTLFRFIQLTCEGHNSEFQNYLRNQPGNTTSVNLIICTVDYLLRLQESIMDFYWHYFSKELVDEAGKANFLRALSVCSQVFNTLTESVQGPCVGNQMALANSRLWDAINGFFFLFANMMDKLSKNHTQLELLREFLSLQKDMIVLMLSMLEGNVLNGSIGKQMVDTLAESQQNVQLILKFFDMFLKLKDLTTSQAFQEFDLNKDGWISPKEFQRAMEGQKMYSIEEINYLMMCTDVNNDGKIDYMEFTERFHNPAKDIGFNLAVLLTNLKEHIVGDNRLDVILQTASSMCDYFDPFLGRIEIMGSNKRVEKVYFEIKEEWLEQFNKPQIKQSKKDFLFNVLQDDGGQQGKLEAFVNFCEDTIFEMSHAAEISSEDKDSRVERAKRQREIFTGQTERHDTISPYDIISLVFQKLFFFIHLCYKSCRPSQLVKAKNQLRDSIASMTYGQLFLSVCRISFKLIFMVAWLTYLILSTLLRFIYFMMGGSKEDDYVALKSLPEPPTSRSLNRQRSFISLLPDIEKSDVHKYEAFGLQLSQGTTEVEAANLVTDHEASKASFSFYIGGSFPAKSKLGSPTDDAQQAYSDAHFGSESQKSFEQDDKVRFQATAYEPKIADVTPKSRGSIFNVLARNFYVLKYITLALAFLINAILLFYRVSVNTAEISDSFAAPPESGNATTSEVEVEEELSIHENYYYLTHVLKCLSVGHCLVSLALLIAYYQLKVPLIIFKREKQVARKLEFEGMWITEMPSEDAVSGKWDSMVISSAKFPEKYWDKFVKRKVVEKYQDQFDIEELHRLLGLDKQALENAGNSGSRSVDWRYQMWKIGVIFADGSFQYLMMYLFFSAVGIWNPFFYAGHLIDVVFSFPMLQTILKSVTHNGKQLILTVMMVVVVVYMYTVLAFNFFRKFYVQDEDGQETDSKCNNMITCFVFNIYAGIRAGGGIGDELQSPYGDEKEAWRILFDVTFYFFIIIILLAIMQGLIIDAFGDLRDQQESAQDKLESNCFICDIGKDFFERLPHGFEHHTAKEHNLAYYLFFLMHLINKDETEYTGQESYVWELYEKRCWDFFPVGECFLKQYEDQLMMA